MKKLVTTAAVLVFVFLGVITLIRSCDDYRTNTDGLDLIEAADEYDLGNEERSDDVVTPTTEEPQSRAPQTDGIDYTAIDEEIEKPPSEEDKVAKKVVTKTPASKPSTTAKPTSKQQTKTTPSGSSTGKFLVVAGSYAVRSNADKAVAQLKKKGFSEAKVVQFDDKKLNVVCAFQSSDYDAANKVVKSLKAKGVDCFIKTRK